MSEEMAVKDNAPTDEGKVTEDEAVVEAAADAVEATSEAPIEVPAVKAEEPLVSEDADIKDDEQTEDVKVDIKEDDGEDDVPMEESQTEPATDDNRGIKRRASTALSDIEEVDENVQFKGFEKVEESSLDNYVKVVERLEAEVTAAVKSITPLRSVRASSISSLRAGKRPRKDTDGSRPSSALSSRSDGDGTGSTDASMSPLSGSRARRATVEMSSPMLRVPLERGWKRELVYRAATDPNTRRNADIYYYSPTGKKLRSNREVSEHLSGTGLTLENFSFFKEPLGIDDPEKEIIRDAKIIRRAESPVPPTVVTVEGKRTPKPKPPKGASPEPPTLKSPPAKLKVKSVGSRLSNNASTPTAVTPKQQRKQQPATAPPAAATAATAAAATNATAPLASATTPATPATAVTDNNNSAAWKKPRPALPALQPRPPPPPAAQPLEPPRQLVQPCSMTCGRGVPSLSCVACLCLYHPACVGLANIVRDKFYCPNCRKSSSPPLEPPPLTHKSGVKAPPSAALVPPPSLSPSGPSGNAQPRRVVVPIPVPGKVAKGEKRVLLRMKVAGGGPDGSRVWAVTKCPNTAAGSSSQSPTPPVPPAVIAPTPTPPAAPRPPAPPPPVAPSLLLANVRPNLPQSLAILNGRRFIVVPRSLVQATNI